MKLRWIEREIEIVTIDSGCYTQTVKVLQYLDETPNRYGKDTWVDVPLEVEELDKGWDDAEKDLATQEPVAWISNDAELPLKEDGSYWLYPKKIDEMRIALYTTPLSREWVGLSDEEINELWYKSQNDIEGVNLGFTTQQHFFARAIEQSLKEKNT